MVFADLQYWANIAAIVGALGVAAAVAALVVAWVQLRQTAKVTHGQMILAVDQALAPYDEIRREAQNPGWEPPANEARGQEDVRHRRRIKQYMGVWERVETLIADQSLDIGSVQQHYGKRVEFLLRNEVIRSYVVDKPNDWSSFHSLAHRLVAVNPALTKYVEEIDGAIARRRSLTGGADSAADV
jgi:hypothetical protein